MVGNAHDQRAMRGQRKSAKRWDYCGRYLQSHFDREFVNTNNRYVLALLTRDRKRFCFKPSQSLPDLVAHYVAGAAGGGKLLAEFVERSPVIVYNRDDVALRLAHRWQLPKQDDRLTVADQ